MELEKPCTTAAQLPEYIIEPTFHRLSPGENHREPLTVITNTHTYDQALESAFSRLTISPDFQIPPQTASFHGLPANIDAVSVPPPMGFGDNQQALIWAQGNFNNGTSLNGPFGFSRPHHRINVAPETMGFQRTAPGDYDNSHFMNYQYHQRQYFYDNYDGCSILHGKEPNNFPVLPLVPQQSNGGGSSSSFYSIHQLNWRLERGLLTEEEIGLILPDLCDLLRSQFGCDFMRSQFGCNFVQKLFAACNEDQRTRIIIALTEFPFKFITICLNSNGAKAITKMLEKLSTPQQISLIVCALTPGACPLSIDPNGQQVITYCVKQFPGEYIKHLLNEIADNCFKVATSKTGCCVLQVCIENSRGEARARLMFEIIANAVHLAEDPYGNYVVQYLLGMKIEELTAHLLRRYQGYFVSLSCNKYASNVVEKFLQESGEQYAAAIVKEMLNSQNASMLLLDPFGNYVIQSALSVSKGRVYDALLNLIQVNAPSMQSNLYGKKVLAWFDKKKLYHA